MNKTQELYVEAKTYIPGGTQLLSKRPEQFLPGGWPAYYLKAEGCMVTDLDHKEYRDFSLMGIGANILGYADKDVNDAVKKVIDNGNMSTLNGPEEVELAKLLCKIHPWANNVRYCRTGGEAMTVAIRIAKAATKNEIILFCGYHGWHDWYLSANLAAEEALDGHLLPGLSPTGVARSLKGSSFPFHYNDTDTLDELLKKYSGNIAAIVMEPIRNIYPVNNFLEKVRARATNNNIPLIIDEISSGWRSCIGGAHLMLGIEPDIAVFAKGMSNGYPMAAIIGKKEFMSAAQISFISSTYWTERIGPAAAISTIKKIIKENIPEYLNAAGKKIQEEWAYLAGKNKIKIKISGIFPMSHFEFETEKPLVYKTLFTQIMLQKCFLATNSYYASFAHKQRDIEEYLNAFDETFEEIAGIIDSKKEPETFLEFGEACHSGFKRLS